MAVFDMRWEGLQKYSAILEAAIAKSPLVVGRVLYVNAIAILVPAVKQRLRDRKNIFRGQLMQRVRARYRSLVTSNSAAVEVGSLGVHYGLDLQEGTKPRKVSPEEAKKIREWVRLKMGRRGDLLDSQTAAVIKTIEAHGTLPHPYLDEAWAASGEMFINSSVAQILLLLSEGLGK